jgi:hypothetical protein
MCDVSAYANSVNGDTTDKSSKTSTSSTTAKSEPLVNVVMTAQYTKNVADIGNQEVWVRKIITCESMLLNLIRDAITGKIQLNIAFVNWQALLMLTFDCASTNDSSMLSVLQAASARVTQPQVTQSCKENKLSDGSTIMCSSWVYSQGPMLTIGKQNDAPKPCVICVPPVWRAVVLALHDIFNIPLNDSLKDLPGSSEAFVQPKKVQQAICELRRARGQTRQDVASYGPLVGMMGARTRSTGNSTKTATRCKQERALAAIDRAKFAQATGCMAARSMTNSEVHAAILEVDDQGDLHGLCGSANSKLIEWVRNEDNDIVYMTTVNKAQGAVVGNKHIKEEYITSSGISVKDFSDSTKGQECFVRVDQAKAVNVKRLLLSLITNQLRPGAFYTVHNGVPTVVTEGVEQMQMKSGKEMWLMMVLRGESGLHSIVGAGHCCAVVLVFGALSGAAPANPIINSSTVWVTKTLHLKWATIIRQAAEKLREEVVEDSEGADELVVQYMLQLQLAKLSWE